MQCNRCGFFLPTGAPTCPRCANPTPYNLGMPPSPYAPPPTQYGPPSQPGPYGPPPQYGPPVMPAYVPPPKKGGGFGAGLAVGIVLLVVCLCCGSIWWAQSSANKDKAARATVYAINSSGTSTAMQAALTPTPFSENQPPSGLNFSGTAQSIITNPQMASEIYPDNQAQMITSTFKPDQTIYLSYKLSAGYTGYIGALWYGGTSTTWSDLLNIENRSGYGDFSISYTGPVQGAVELYWCNQSDCSDRELAWVRTFQVTY